MKNLILLKPYNHSVFYNDRVFKLQNGHNAFYSLDKYLKKHGYEVHTIDYPEKDTSVYLYADMPYPWQLSQWLNIFLKRKAKHILIVLESPVINPFNQWKFLQSFFTTVLAWDKNTKKPIVIPQLEPKVSISKTKKKLLVVINAKKNIPLLFRFFSLNYKNLYQVRLRAINTCMRLIPDSFDLYGKGWSKTTSFRGLIDQDKKLSVLSQYSFCLCLENTVANGYLTEKIFDCFKAKTVPIYYGDPNVTEDVPSDCFIDFNRFRSYTELLTFIQNMPAADYQKMQKAGVTFLKGPSSKKYSQKLFFKRLLKEISDVQ